MIKWQSTTFYYTSLQLFVLALGQNHTRNNANPSSSSSPMPQSLLVIYNNHAPNLIINFLIHNIASYSALLIALEPSFIISQDSGIGAQILGSLNYMLHFDIHNTNNNRQEVGTTIEVVRFYKKVKMGSILLEVLSSQVLHSSVTHLAQEKQFSETFNFPERTSNLALLQMLEGIGVERGKGLPMMNSRSRRGIEVSHSPPTPSELESTDNVRAGLRRYQFNNPPRRLQQSISFFLKLV
eukprot:Gb_34544 [translate_table: standard]